MESFRVRHSDSEGDRVLLLPLSLGTCSVALLHILSQHLKGQPARTGRTGFKIHVLYVETAEASDDGPEEPMSGVRQFYPEHEYSVIRLSDVFSIEGADELFDLVATKAPPESSNDQKLTHLSEAIGSATSRQDVRSHLLRRLITAFAKDHQCEAILWADSTTKLAERTLAETAKGRGASLPWIVADGESPSGIPSYHPLQDLLRKEVAAFISLLCPDLAQVVKAEVDTPAVSTKNTTIDALMKQYFESVEREYPSIVANVVKTSGKLQAPPLSGIEQQCELCDLPLEEGKAPEKSRLCYGCVRTLSLPTG